jgi:hypothetical protein
MCIKDEPCKNGATCVDDNKGDYTCNCKAGFRGKDCETTETPSGLFYLKF